MDIYSRLSGTSHAPQQSFSETSVMHTVDMHTAGEPTRILLPDCLDLQGNTLLEKRAYAKAHVDYIRQRLMHEPRGHAEMYGAILVKETELTACGEADIGVLFCHNEGYSTMCGHATIALGRFLVDTQDRTVFPRRGHLVLDSVKGETVVRLHAPCGVVRVSVPTIRSDDGVKRSDGTRKVSFLSVPSFVAARDVKVEVPEEMRWHALRDAGRTDVMVDIVYGGAFYAIVSVEELGFKEGVAGNLRLFDEACGKVKWLLAGRKELFVHPSEDDLQYLYGVIIVDQRAREGYGELGVCFFADQQVDRSPTGSGVSARVALEVERGRLRIAEKRLYESIVSLKARGIGFEARAVEKIVLEGRGGRQWEGVRVEVHGMAFYTGAHAFVVEKEDQLGDGFMLGWEGR